MTKGVGKKIFVYGRPESIPAEPILRAILERFIAFVCHPSADIPPRSALGTCTHQPRARKCFVTIVAVNCTCQPDIIDPARGEQLRTWVEGTWSEASATRDK